MTHDSKGEEALLVPDGGQSRPTKEKQTRELEQLFVEVTGTESVTESQQSTHENKEVAGQKDSTLSGYVAEITRNDGLDETLPDPETGTTD